jgi:hypothetical protein
LRRDPPVRVSTSHRTRRWCFNGGAVGQFSTHPLVGGKVVNNTGVPDPQSAFGTTNDPAISTKTFPNLQQGVRGFYCQNHPSTMQGVIFVK